MLQMWEHHLISAPPTQRRPNAQPRHTMVRNREYNHLSPHTQEQGQGQELARASYLQVSRLIPGCMAGQVQHRQRLRTITSLLRDRRRLWVLGRLCLVRTRECNKRRPQYLPIVFRLVASSQSDLPRQRLLVRAERSRLLQM